MHTVLSTLLFEGNTYKVEVCVVHGCLLFAVVQYNNDWVDQITGKADVRQRSPQAQRQNFIHKPCADRYIFRYVLTEANYMLFFWLTVVLSLISKLFTKIWDFKALLLPPYPSSQARMIQTKARAQSERWVPW